MIIFIIVVVFVLLLFLPIRIKSKVIFNFLSNSGYISMFLFKLKIFLGKISLLPTKIVIKTKNKTRYLCFLCNDKDNTFGEKFFTNLIQNIKIKNLRLFGKLGLLQDCLFTSLSCGGILMGFGVLYSLLNTKRGIVASSLKLFPDYKYNTILLCFTGSIQLCLFAILKSFVKTICDYVKRSQYGNKETN